MFKLLIRIAASHRIVLLSSAVLGAALIMLVYLEKHIRRSSINVVNYEAIVIGMTLAETEQLLGGPMRYEQRGSTEPILPSNCDRYCLDAYEQRMFRGYIYLDMPGYAEEQKVRAWHSNECLIIVQYDNMWRVMAKEVFPFRQTRSNGFDRFLSFLRVR